MGTQKTGGSGTSCPSEQTDGTGRCCPGTDTYNEIDDQFAVSYLICSAEKLHLQAIYAAPFFNEKSTGPADGMEKSYQEILNILTLMGKDELKKSVYKGSTGYLPDEETAVESPAAADLAVRAMNYTPEKPLYVLAIGASQMWLLQF